MLKKSLLLAIGALLAQGALAETLTPDAALKRAISQEGGRHINATVQPKLVYTTKTSKGEAAVYVFNQAGEGSLILSASDLAYPMLGYTDSGSFDPSNIPPQMQMLFDEYARQIEYAEAHDYEPLTKNVGYSYPASWTYIAPLLTTLWDQGQPYNCKLRSTAYATGCVATAMAQIMKYHNYPEVGHGSNKYTDAYGNSYSLDFSTIHFDWDNMINEYSNSTTGKPNNKYTQAQADAVGNLMLACGIATDMNYGSQSGTQAEEAAIGLVKYFGYSNQIQALQRNLFTHTDWAATLYDQLKNVGPVLYSGHSLGNFAHAFVLDGYDGNGYFHVNWGWSGMANGYYSLDALTPDTQGTGGSLSGYNFTQGMIINIMPSDGTPSYTLKPEFTLLGSATYTVTNGIIWMTMSEANPGNLLNNSMAAAKPTLFIKIQGVDNDNIAYEKVINTYFAGNPFGIPVMEPGQYIDPQMSVTANFKSSLPDGKYKMQIVWSDTSQGIEYEPFLIANGCYDYAFVTKKGTDYVVENIPEDRFTIVSAEVLTPLYMRNPVQIRWTVKNDTDTELTQSIVPVLLYGENKKLSFEGDSQLVTVAPHSTETALTTYTFTNLPDGTLPTVSTPREYILGAYDYGKLIDRYYQSGDFRESYYGDLGTVTMKRSESGASIRLSKIAVANAKEEGLVEGVGYVYGINQFSNIELSVTIVGEKGFVSAPLSAIIYEYDPTTMTPGAVVYEKNFERIIFVEEGQTETQTTYLQPKDLDVSKMYYIQVFYTVQKVRQSLGSIRVAASSGVEGVTADASLEVTYDGLNILASSATDLTTVEIYDLSGKAIQVAAGGSAVSLNVSSLAKGIYLVKAVDGNGNSKTIKINK